MDQGTLQTQDAEPGVAEQAKQKVSDAAGQAQEAVAEKTHEAQQVRELLGQLDHAVGGLVQVAVDPVVGALQPDLAVALVAPARHGRLRHLDLRVPVEVLRHRDRLDGLLVVVHLAQQEVDPVRPLEPPVAEQLGVVGRDDQRRPASIAPASHSTCFSRLNMKLPACSAALSERRLRVVGLLVVGFGR